MFPVNSMSEVRTKKKNQWFDFANGVIMETLTLWRSVLVDVGKLWSSLSAKEQSIHTFSSQ